MNGDVAAQHKAAARWWGDMATPHIAAKRKKNVRVGDRAVFLEGRGLQHEGGVGSSRGGQKQ